MKDEPVVVLDACTRIAYFNDEAGAEVVSAALQEVAHLWISAVNLLEIAYDAVKRTGDATSASRMLEMVSELPLQIHWHLDPRMIESAAGFKARFRVSMADAVALALAAKYGAPLMTCDHHEFDPFEKAGKPGSSGSASNKPRPPPTKDRRATSDE